MAKSSKSKKVAPDSNEPALDIPAPKKSKESKKVTRELAAEAAAAASKSEPGAAATGSTEEGAVAADAQEASTGEAKKDGKKKKRSRETEDESKRTEEEDDKKSKKKRKADKGAAKPAETKKAEAPAEQPVKIKKRKPTDPYTLEELSVPAQRAIQYAQTLGMPTFKFNKGRQNHLMRNWASAAEVPEEFMEDVLRYLRSVMGGSRDILIKNAREILARALPTPAAPEAEHAAAADLSASKETVEGKGEDEVEAEVEETPEQAELRLLKTGKERAERLLKSLGVPLS